MEEIAEKYMMAIVAQGHRESIEMEVSLCGFRRQYSRTAELCAPICSVSHVCPCWPGLLCAMTGIWGVEAFTCELAKPLNWPTLWG
jgi:hypothetical protein